MTQKEILKSLEKLFEEAEEKNLWFYYPYLERWFSPKELRELHSQGKFIISSINWELKNPVDHLASVVKNICSMINEMDDFIDRIRDKG